MPSPEGSNGSQTHHNVHYTEDRVRHPVNNRPRIYIGAPSRIEQSQTGWRQKDLQDVPSREASTIVVGDVQNEVWFTVGPGLPA